jgi:hypothetical protein
VLRSKTLKVIKIVVNEKKQVMFNSKFKNN